MATLPTRRPQPILLIRGFGGMDVSDEKAVAYQGFNDGTVYPQRRGENYIYEGMVLRFLKSHWQFHDATNVVGYFENEVKVETGELPKPLQRLDPGYFSGHKILIDPGMAWHLLRKVKDPERTLWIFRYYDLNDRKFDLYGEALVRVIAFIRDLAVRTGAPEKPRVNIIAHSMGGLIVRHAIQKTYAKGEAEKCINKIVTLGTPHGGISFQVIKDWMVLDASEELEQFNPTLQKNEKAETSLVNFHKHFPLERVLTVVGTNYRSYSVGGSSALNRFFSWSGESGPNYNRSDGLVKQASAQIPGAPRTFVHKCHGGRDSLVTSREAFEIATRFFFGNVRARLRLVQANITRGQDMFGKSEFFLGVSIKPRKVDFDLFHQSADAENCYGPFRKADLSDSLDDVSFDWADDNRLIWEGYLDCSSILEDESVTTKDMVIRLDFYVGERDLFGIGFSDNVIFRKQYYVQAKFQPRLELFVHTSEEFGDPKYDWKKAQHPVRNDHGWEFNVGGTGFEGRFRIELDNVPEDGEPSSLTKSPS